MGGALQFSISIWLTDGRKKLFTTRVCLLKDFPDLATSWSYNKKDESSCQLRPAQSLARKIVISGLDLFYTSVSNRGLNKKHTKLKKRSIHFQLNFRGETGGQLRIHWRRKYKPILWHNSFIHPESPYPAQGLSSGFLLIKTWIGYAKMPPGVNDLFKMNKEGLPSWGHLIINS